eukprot:TRINITY_DN1188_c1_g1_i2.p13 TRINITY_DN1188_c1_g1~~TRINITY_DN1188_c1_g1_i2.p13  ORF type:complete len:101 (-),score=0.14 TRINITY_DN1188_c1_g1_i2:567-869(-)
MWVHYAMLQVYYNSTITYLISDIVKTGEIRSIFNSNILYQNLYRDNMHAQKTMKQNKNNTSTKNHLQSDDNKKVNALFQLFPNKIQRNNISNSYKLLLIL